MIRECSQDVDENYNYYFHCKINEPCSSGQASSQMCYLLHQSMQSLVWWIWDIICKALALDILNNSYQRIHISIRGRNNLFHSAYKISIVRWSQVLIDIVIQLVTITINLLEKANMTGLWMFLICLSVLIGSVYAGKGSAVSNACHVKCDVVQELTLLRQLLNQESILRINTNNEIQELKKMIKDIVTEHRQNRNQVNTSIEEIAMKIDSLDKGTITQLTEVTMSLQRLEQATDSKIENVKATVQRTRRSITALETDNISIKQGQSTLESSITSLQNDYRQARQDLTSVEKRQ